MCSVPERKDIDLTCLKSPEMSLPGQHASSHEVNVLCSRAPEQKSARANVFADRKGIEQMVNDLGFAGGSQLSSERRATQILRFSEDPDAGMKGRRKPTRADISAAEAGVAIIAFERLAPGVCASHLRVPLIFTVSLTAAHGCAAQQEAQNLGLPPRTYGTARSADEQKRVEKRLEAAAAAAGSGIKKKGGKICDVRVTLARDCSLQA